TGKAAGLPFVHPIALGAGCARRCRLFQRRCAARLGSAARMASEAAVAPPAPRFMEFVSESSQATPPLVARAAARIKMAGGARTAGASARLPAVPPPAPRFMEFV